MNTLRLTCASVFVALVLVGAGCKGASSVASPPAAAPEDGVLKFGEGMTRPTPLAPGELVYTPEAAAARVSGTAVVRCIITKDGSVKACRVVRSVPLMDDAVIGALERHRSSPVTLAGRPIDVDYTYTIRLKLPGEANATPPAPPVPNVAVDDVLAALEPRFRQCYDAGLRQRPMAGQVVHVVTVQPNGTVGPIWHLKQQGNLSGEVLACLATVLASATFAPPRGGHSVAVEFPLTLGAADAGP